MHKRGLSDVVTTVLIILLVVVSIVSIGAYITRTVNQGGRVVQGTTLCLTNTLEPLSCALSGAAGAYTATLTSQRKTDSNGVNLTRATYFFVNASVSLNRTMALSRFSSLIGSMSEALSPFAVRLPSVYVVGEYTLANGNRFSCTSKTIACTLPDCVTSVQSICQSRTACLWLDATTTGCFGEPTACQGLQYAACVAQEGCDAYSDYRNCYGDAISCDMFEDESSCAGQSGCYPVFNGNCDQLEDEGQCNAQPGCTAIGGGDCHQWDGDSEACEAMGGCAYDGNEGICDGNYYTECTGNYFSECGGNANQCSPVFLSEDECRAQQGCTADAPFQYCQGVAALCVDYMTNPSGCTGHAGCTWTIGRPAQCVVR